MGKQNSKPATISGDPQVAIINQLEQHSEAHTDHDVKLTIILALVGLLLVVKVYQCYKKHVARQALIAAKSVAVLNTV